MILLSACNNNSQYDQYQLFSRAEFKDSTNAKIEVIDFTTPPHPASFFVIRDSIILVDNYSANPYFIGFYNLRTKELITEAIHKGRGPSEFLGCDLYYSSNNDSIFIHDRITNEIAFCNIDSILINRTRYCPIKQKLSNQIKEVSKIAGTKYVAISHWFIDNIKYRNNSVPELATFDLKDESIDIHTIKNCKYYPSNITGGFLIVSKNKKKIVSPYFYDDKIIFYDEHLKPILQLKGPDIFEVELKTSKSDPKMLIFDDQKYFRAYYKPFYTSKHIYLLYAGINGVDRNSNYCKPVEVFKIDWNGNLIHRYSLDRYVYTISVNEAETIMYGTSCTTFKETPKLVKIDLK